MLAITGDEQVGEYAAELRLLTFGESPIKQQITWFTFSMRSLTKVVLQEQGSGTTADRAVGDGPMTLRRYLLRRIWVDLEI